jgi:hypothetical protein
MTPSALLLCGIAGAVLLAGADLDAGLLTRLLHRVHRDSIRDEPRDQQGHRDLRIPEN